jgi:hypothetical protein
VTPVLSCCKFSKLMHWWQACCDMTSLHSHLIASCMLVLIHPATITGLSAAGVSAVQCTLKLSEIQNKLLQLSCVQFQ